MERRSAPSVVAARVLVDELVRCGLAEAVLAPGSRSAPLALALAAEARVRLHVRIDERSAGFTALGLAKASGTPATVSCTSGTATANLLPAVVEASEARAPLLVLTADRPPELRGTGANQTIDQVGLYGRYARWSADLGVPGPDVGRHWRSAASRAWAEAVGALGGPPGPVHLNLPFREPLVVPDGAAVAVPEGRGGGGPWTAVAAAPRPPTEVDVATLVALVTRAERGLVVVGDCASDPGPVLALAEAAGWPVVAEPSGNARRGPQALAAGRSLLADERWTATARPSVVLVVGRVGLSRQVLRLLASEVPQLVVEPYGGWADPGRTADRLAACDPAALATAALARVLPRGESPWLRAWRSADAAARRALDAVLDATPEPSEPRTARDLAAMLPDGALLVAGSSMPIRDLDLAMAPRAGVRVVANRGASGIDGMVSTAVGAALVHPGPAFALLGDLTLLHDQNGLLLAGQPEPDLVIVVADNDGGGIFSLLEQADVPGFERVFGTPHGVDLAAVARAAGRGHRRVAAAAALSDAVAEARAAGGVQLVEVRTDRRANADLHRRLQAAVGEAVAGVLPPDPVSPPGPTAPPGA